MANFVDWFVHFLSCLLLRRMECLNRVLVLTLLCWPSGSGLVQDCGACAGHQLMFSWLPDATREHLSSSRSSRSNEGSCVTSYYRGVHSIFMQTGGGGADQAATFLDGLTITRSKATSKQSPFDIEFLTLLSDLCMFQPNCEGLIHWYKIKKKTCRGWQITKDNDFYG